MKKMTSLLLALVMCMSLSVVAMATSDAPENIPIGSEEDVNATVYVEGPKVGDNAPRASSYLLFSMTATNVSDLVTTRSSNKSFTKSDLTLGRLRFYGTVTNSYGSSVNSRVGACRLDPYGEFVADIVGYFPSGSNYSWSGSKSQLYDGATYYGFIKNNSGVSGTMASGRVTFENADYD